MKLFTVLLLIISLLSSMVLAGTPVCVECEKHRTAVGESQRNASAIGAFVANCKAPATVTDSVKLQLDCVKNHLKGFFANGLGADLQFAGGALKTAAVEGSRLVVSANPAGNFILKALKVKTTDEKVAAFVKEWGPKSFEVAKILFKLQNDPFYQAEVATKLASAVMALAGQASTDLKNASCTDVYRSFCKVMGEVEYNVVISVLLAVLTAEAGGAAGEARIAAALTKLANTSPKAAKFLKDVLEAFKASRSTVEVAEGTQKAAETAKAANAGADAVKPVLNTAKSGRFVPIDDANAAFKDADATARKRLEDIKERRRQIGAPPMTAEEEEQAVAKIKDRKLSKAGFDLVGRQGEGVHVVTLDTPMGPGVTIDHHGRYYVNGRPKFNTTKQVLADIDTVMAGPGSDAEKLAKLKAKYRVVTTDNLGDGGWSVWIAQNLERVAKDAQLRKTIRVATEYEDFGLFGTKFDALAKAKPGIYKQPQEVQQSILFEYDKILKEAGLPSDRIPQLPPEKQKQIMEKVGKVIDRSLSDPQYRAENAKHFVENRVAASQQIEKSHELYRQEILGKIQSEKGPEEAQRIVRKVESKVYVYDGDRVDTKQLGVFSSWGGPPHNHNLPMELTFTSGPEGRTRMILAAPDGRELPVESLRPIASKIQQEHLHNVIKEVEQADRAAGKSAAEISRDMTEATKKEQFAVFGRDRAQFSFTGVKVSPQRILEIISESLP